MRWFVLMGLAAISSAIAGEARYEPSARQSVKLAPKPGPNAVEVLEQRSSRTLVVIGHVSVKGEPTASKEDLVIAARAKAAEVGADFMVPRGARDSDGAFIAIVGVYPKATLGLVFQPAEAEKGGRTVIGFRRGSKAASAGVQVGDRVLALDGMPYSHGRLLDFTLRAKPGQIVKVALKRGESNLAVDVPLVAND